ncbi:hypothetical protein K439DRAFT_144023 [Ramaria rubella]|nr:hypothetical protein K439DRAFT_144023 [Ramaria rubella]
MAALHVLQDRQSLQNIGAELNHAMTLFQVCNVRSLQENIRDLQYDMMGLRDDMNNLKDEVKCLRDDTKGMMEKLDNTLRTMNQTLSKIEEQYVKGPTIPAESWTSSLVGKDIAETVKDAQSNVDDAVRLAEKICKQVEGVPASPEQSEPRALPSILGNSIKLPPEGSRR